MRYNYNDIDLHIHTTISDGEYTGKQIVKRAYDMGLKLISITDHNRFTDNDDTKNLAKEYGIKVIPGVEFTVQLNDIFFHLLAYFNEKNVDKLNYLFSIYNRKKYKKVVEFMKILKDKNILITTENINKFGQLSFKNIARAMVDEGYVNSIDEAMKKYIDNRQLFDCRVGLSVISVIEAIHDIGGIVSFAHPFRSFSNKIAVRSMIEQLVGMGLDGIECYNGRQLSDMTNILRGFAIEYNLMETGGSDFHEARGISDLGIRKYISLDRVNIFLESFI